MAGMEDREIKRDSLGRWQPGQSGNPAGPRTRTREAEIYQTLLEVFDEETRQGMKRAFQKKLMEGSNATWREVSKYILPTVSRTEHTGADGEPLVKLSDIVAALQALERGEKPPEQNS